MGLPQRRWYRIADVAKRWNMSICDIEDYALDERLELSVFVVDLPVEASSADITISSPQGVHFLNGPQPLARLCLIELFREGKAEIRYFPAKTRRGYLHLRSGTPPLFVRREDLILTAEERDRFEREHGLLVDVPKPSTPADAWHSEDFRRVRIANEWFRFGPKQAAVLRRLKAASDSDNPWLDGKRLLDEVDAATMRLIDLFKRKPAWRKLIVPDGKGRYRLNVEVLSPERQRIRVYRQFESDKWRGVAIGR